MRGIIINYVPDTIVIS